MVVTLSCMACHKAPRLYLDRVHSCLLQVPSANGSPLRQNGEESERRYPNAMGRRGKVWIGTCRLPMRLWKVLWIRSDDQDH